jgi:hypothetical protein
LFLCAQLKLSDGLPISHQEFLSRLTQKAWSLERSLPGAENLNDLWEEFITRARNPTFQDQIREVVNSSQVSLNANDALEQFFNVFGDFGRSYSSETNLVITRRTRLGCLRGTIHVSLSHFNSAIELQERLMQGIQTFSRCTNSLNCEVISGTQEFPIPSLMLTMPTKEGHLEVQIFLHLADFAVPFNNFMDKVNELALERHCWLNPMAHILSMCFTLMAENGLTLTKSDQEKWINAETHENYLGAS